MSIRRFGVFIALAVTLTTGCREPDRPTGLDGEGSVYVDSDPQGAKISVDGKGTGLVTPALVRGLSYRGHDIEVVLETDGLRYGYAVIDFEVRRDATDTITGPLLLRCADAECRAAINKTHRPAGMSGPSFVTNPSGTLLFVDGSGGGLVWPASTTNSYIANAAPLFAGVVGTTTEPTPLALGLYNVMGTDTYLAGRPVPVVRSDANGWTLEQTTWILPPPLTLQTVTVRGIALEQKVFVPAGVDDLLIVRTVFRNITGDASYALMDPLMPEGGVTFDQAWVGFAVDADIGPTADDDMLSYAPDLDLAFIYDGNFRETGFTGGWADRPAMVGLRVLEAPAGSTVVLNGWPSSADWLAGKTLNNGLQEGHGWFVINATQTFLPNHADPRIGYFSDNGADMRMVASAGPLTLAPGDTAVLTVAIVLAPPQAGSYTPGTVVAAGDPTDAARQILQVAAPLLARAKAAESLLPPD